MPTVSTTAGILQTGNFLTLSESTLFLIASSSTLVLGLCIIESVAERNHYVSRIHGVELIDTYVGIFNQRIGLSAVQKILTRYLQTETVIKEGLGQGEVKCCNMIIQMYVLMVTGTLVKEVHLTRQVRAEHQHVVPLNLPEHLIHINLTLQALNLKPLLVESAHELRTPYTD